MLKRKRREGKEGMETGRLGAGRVWGVGDVGGGGQLVNDH